MTRPTTARKRRIGAVLALMALLAAYVVGAPSPASASTGGSADATGLDLTVGEVSAGPIVIIPGLTATVAEATEPAPDANGNGIDTDTVAVGVGPVDLAALTAEVQRTTSGLTSTSEITDFALTIAGTEIVAADLVSSISICPIPGAGSPSSNPSLANLTVGGLAASVGDTNVVVDVGDLGVPTLVNSAQVYVNIDQQQAADATSASATGLIIDVNIVVDLIGLPAIGVDLVDLSLAATACTQPAGIAPVGIGIDPASGPELTPVTITGTGFVPGFTTVDIATETVVAGDTTVSADGTTVSFLVPAGTPVGPTTVTATTPAGTTGPLDFTVTALAPTASSISPPQGPEGTTVTVTGTNFQPGATTVDLGSTTIAAADVTVAGDGTSLTFDVPVGSPLGPTTVTATTAGGTTGPLGFVVTSADAPTATSITPEFGPVGTTVTVTGSDFVPGATTVDFGSITVPVGDVTVAGDGTSLTFDVPVGSPLGPTTVTATTPAGTTGPLGFVVTTGSAPTTTGITPDMGPVGTTVTVTGTGFVPGATDVDFGSITVPVGDVTVAGDGTSLTFDVPVGSPLGATTVVVNTPDGSSGPLGFLVTAGEAPTATGLDPDEGPGGTTVVVDGSGFVPGATEVHFGDVVIPATEVVVAADGTELTFTVPADAPLGATPVTVVTPDGESGPLTFTVTTGNGGGNGGNGNGGGGSGSGNGSGGSAAAPASSSGSLPYTGGAGAGLLTTLSLGLLLVGAAFALCAHLLGRDPRSSLVHRSSSAPRR